MFLGYQENIMEKSNISSFFKQFFYLHFLAFSLFKFLGFFSLFNEMSNNINDYDSFWVIYDKIFKFLEEIKII